MASSENEVRQTVRRLAAKGVRLWVADGRLLYRAPKGAMTDEERGQLRSSGAELVALLEESAGDCDAHAERPGAAVIHTAPLSHSQWAHWRLFHLHERHSSRQIASANRLKGPLRLDALQRSLAAVVDRHDALRTRIVVRNGAPVQETLQRVPWELRKVDLRHLAGEPLTREIDKAIEKLLLAPIDLAVDPLFAVTLLILRPDEHILLVAMDHVISDAFSMGVFLREVFTSYTRYCLGRAAYLPEIPLQFGEFCAWQQRSLPRWKEKHGRYWSERLAGCDRLSLPEDENLPAAHGDGWATAPISIDKVAKAQLYEYCRRIRATPAMCALTAFVALVLRWCEVSDAVIQYQGDGREDRRTEHAIGYFASVVSLRANLGREDTFADLLHRVVDEYCAAIEHSDACYLRPRSSRPFSSWTMSAELSRSERPTPSWGRLWARA